MDKLKEAENLLKNYRYLKKNKEILERRIKRCSRKLMSEDGIKGIDYDTIPSGKTNKVTSIVEQMAIKSIEQLEAKKQELKDISDIIQDIETAIDGLKVQEKRLVKLFYLSEEKMTWKMVSGIMYMNIDYAKGNFRKNSIRNFAKAYYGMEVKK